LEQGIIAVLRVIIYIMIISIMIFNNRPPKRPIKAPKLARMAFSSGMPCSSDPSSAPIKGPKINPRGPSIIMPARSPSAAPHMEALVPPKRFVPMAVVK
jgi:hypothetical protein